MEAKPNSECSDLVPMVFCYRGVEHEPYHVIYAPRVPVPVEKPRRARLNLAKLNAFLDDWREWKRQTVGKRIRCQRHHLEQRLTHFSKDVVQKAICLARVGEAGVPVAFSDAFVETKNYMKGHEPLSVIFEYYARFEDLVLEGVRLLQEHEASVQSVPEVSDLTDMLDAEDAEEAAA